jgi:uncharacterized protein
MMLWLAARKVAAIDAHRSDEAMHAPYREWFEALVAGPEPFGLSVLVAGGFMPCVTHRKIFAIEALAAHPRCRVVAPGPQHLEHFATLCRGTNAAGKLAADAQHAAIAIEHGCTWVHAMPTSRGSSSQGPRFEHLVLEPTE